MRLWTTMPARVYKETIEKTGIYQCDPDKSEVLTWDDSGRQFANAYDWMSRYMTEKIGPPPEGIKYPVWAWYRLRTRQARPDLRWVEFRGAANEMVLIELEKEDSQVVLSDEEIWTVAQLNDTAWCRNDEELDCTIIRIWKERKNSRKSPGTGYLRSIRLLMCRQLSGNLEKKRSKRSGSTTNKPSVWAAFFRQERSISCYQSVLSLRHISLIPFSE